MMVKKGKRYMNTDKIIIRGLRQNNLKNISLEIPKEKILNMSVEDAYERTDIGSSKNAGLY